LSYSFDKKSENEKKEESNDHQIRSLTDDYGFCPKCGAKNKFELTQDDSEVIYLCWQCSSELNDLWEDFQNDQISLVVCVNCHQYTFKDHKICASCGLLKSKISKPDEAVHKRFSTKNQSGESLLIYKKAETTAEKLFGGAGLRINPNHPQAKKATTILCICMIFLLALAAGLLAWLLTGW